MQSNYLPQAKFRKPADSSYVNLSYMLQAYTWLLSKRDELKSLNHVFDLLKIAIWFVNSLVVIFFTSALAKKFRNDTNKFAGHTTPPRG